MRIWLVTVGEPLPLGNHAERLLRTGALANVLAARGHHVVWWSSTVDHNRKVHRFDADTTVQLRDHVKLRLLHSVLYRRNISIARLLNHRGVARKFAAQAEDESRPDVILCSLPTIELSVEVVQYGRAHGVPAILDLRDMWPDILVGIAPRWARRGARLLLSPMFRDIRRACAGATALVGITPQFVDWGIGYAGRARTPLDRDFPLAYTERSPSADAIVEAEHHWEQLGVRREDFVACFFGTIRPQIETSTIIRAARILARTSTKRFRFVLCGDGEDLERMRREAADCPSVLFPGWVDSAKIWTLMRRSTVGLAPYRSTPDFVASIPNKPIEYFSAGLPVISSLGGVLADLLAKHDCGVTYANESAEELARTLDGLTPADLARKSQNARRLFSSSFVGEKVYCAMADYLEEVAHVQRVAARQDVNRARLEDGRS